MARVFKVRVYQTIVEKAVVYIKAENAEHAEDALAEHLSETNDFDWEFYETEGGYEMNVSELSVEGREPDFNAYEILPLEAKENEA